MPRRLLYVLAAAIVVVIAFAAPRLRSGSVRSETAIAAHAMLPRFEGRWCLDGNAESFTIVVHADGGGAVSLPPADSKRALVEDAHFDGDALVFTVRLRNEEKLPRDLRRLSREVWRLTVIQGTATLTYSRAAPGESGSVVGLVYPCGGGGAGSD